MKLDTFEFSIYKKLKIRPQQKYLLGISGGLDSVALLHVFWRISQKLSLSFAVAHVHHGKRGSREQVAFRDQAQRLVEARCAEYKIPFLTNSDAPQGASEASLREFRYQFFANQKFDTWVMAHHADDLLETRLIRLIRGTGAQGLKSMSESQPHIFRPFLESSRQSLKNYVQKWKLEWIDDPSNTNEKMLRNWVRNHWLVDLEKKRKGATQSLARSLELICQSQDSALVEASPEFLDRQYLASVDVAKKQQLIAKFLLARKVTNYSRNQINEVIKRLNTKRKHFAFDVARVRWQVSDKQLTLA